MRNRAVDGADRPERGLLQLNDLLVCTSAWEDTELSSLKSHTQATNDCAAELSVDDALPPVVN